MPSLYFNNPYLSYLLGHVRGRNLKTLFGGGDESQLMEPLKENAKQVETLADNIGVDHKSLAPFALFTIYDLAILIDDTNSMLIDRRKAIKNLEGFLAALIHIYSHCGKGKHGKVEKIQFLNGDESADQIDEAGIRRLLRIHDYSGLRRVGTQLEHKILKPLITKGMKRPLLILIIVNGKAVGEESTKFPTVIQDCISQLKSFPGGKSSVFFQFCDAGGNGEAGKLFAELEKHQELRPHIDYQPDNMDIAFDGSFFTASMLDKIAKIMLSGLSHAGHEPGPSFHIYAGSTGRLVPSESWGGVPVYTEIEFQLYYEG